MTKQCTCSKPAPHLAGCRPQTHSCPHPHRADSSGTGAREPCTASVPAHLQPPARHPSHQHLHGHAQPASLLCKSPPITLVETCICVGRNRCNVGTGIGRSHRACISACFRGSQAHLPQYVSLQLAYHHSREARSPCCLFSRTLHSKQHISLLRWNRTAVFIP